MLENLLADDNWINNVSMINNNEDTIILNSSVQIQNNGMYLIILCFYKRKKVL